MCSCGPGAGTSTEAQGTGKNVLCVSARPQVCVCGGTPSPWHLPCCSQTVQASAWPTRDQAWGQRAARLVPEGAWGPPLCPLLGSWPPSPSFILTDPKAHPRAQPKLEVSGIHGKKAHTGGEIPKAWVPHTPGLLLPGEGSRYLLFSQPGGLPVPTLPHEWGTSPPVHLSKQFG